MASGWTVAHRSFDEFGNVNIFRDANGALLGTSSRLLGADTDPFLIAAPTIWAGHQFDDESGLYDMKARWYDPESHRFLSEDPAKADNNLYRYGNGDPVNNVDPDGRIVVVVGVGIGIGVTAIASSYY